MPARDDEGPVLIVDDSAYARRRLRRFLSARGWQLFAEAADCDEALAACAAVRPVLVVVDQIMRGREGLETAQLLLEKDPTLRIVMMTVVEDPRVRQQARQVGIEQVLHKNELEALGELLNPSHAS